MPIIEESNIDWARQIEEHDTEAETKAEKGFKKAVEYKDEGDKRFKVTNIFKVDRVKLPKSVVERKKLKKFGDAANDPPGVNPATTVVADEVLMQFLTSREDAMKDSEPAATQMTKIQCRLCKGDHWTTKCPFKDFIESGKSNLSELAEVAKKGTSTEATSSTGAYRPPAARPGADLSMQRKLDTTKSNEYTIRVTNLSEEATEGDVMDIFKPFGKVTRTYLATDKVTKKSRGFAFVNFAHKEDAERAILGVNGYGYHHLILKVEWAK